MTSKLAPLAFALATLGSTPVLAATYAINQIDYIDSVTGVRAAFTQLWGNNNNGKVIGAQSADPTGATGVTYFIYDPAIGAFSLIPPPPGVDPTQMGAISINDWDEIAGVVFDPAGVTTQGFILRAGTYTFFSRPGWQQTWPRTMGNHTALHPQGLVVGYSYNPTLVPGYTSNYSGFLYDPVANTFTDIPTPPSTLTIAQGLNIAGQVVGNIQDPALGGRRSGFLYTPTTSDPMAGGSVTPFQIAGFSTRARGINDHGILTAAVNDVPGSSATHVYVGTSLGYQRVDMPSAVGPDCPGGGAPGGFPEGLNNAGQITGILFDNAGACATHGFIATPSYVPTGTTPSGAFIFSIDVVPNTPYFLDPAVAIGYDFAIGKKDPRFSTVRLPLGIGNNKYVLVVGKKTYDLNAGQLFDFVARGYKKGVKGFRVACIDPAAQLDPVNSLAFPTEVTFATAGRFTGTQQPLTRIKYRGRDLAAMSQAECRGRMLGSDDGEGPDPD